MQRRPLILVALLAVLAAGYGLFVLRPAAVPIEAMVVQPPGVKPSFAFDRDLILAEVRVDPAGTDDAAPGAPLWHLVRNPDADSPPDPLRTLRYGRGIRGMSPGGAPGSAGSLEPGRAYRLSGRADEGVFTLDFVAR